jgi:hypothetical protein
MNTQHLKDTGLFRVSLHYIEVLKSLAMEDHCTLTDVYERTGATFDLLVEIHAAGELYLSSSGWVMRERPKNRQPPSTHISDTAENTTLLIDRNPMHSEEVPAEQRTSKRQSLKLGITRSTGLLSATGQTQCPKCDAIRLLREGDDGFVLLLGRGCD